MLLFSHAHADTLYTGSYMLPLPSGLTTDWFLSPPDAESCLMQQFAIYPKHAMASDLKHADAQLLQGISMLIPLLRRCRSTSVTASLCSGAFDTRNTTRHAISLPVLARSHRSHLCLQYVFCPWKAILEHSSMPANHECTSLVLHSVMTVVTVSTPYSLSALRLETNDESNEYLCELYKYLQTFCYAIGTLHSQDNDSYSAERLLDALRIEIRVLSTNHEAVEHHE